jgi:hypothetical protein
VTTHVIWHIYDESRDIAHYAVLTSSSSSFAHNLTRTHSIRYLITCLLLTISITLTLNKKTIRVVTGPAVLKIRILSKQISWASWSVLGEVYGGVYGRLKTAKDGFFTPKKETVASSFSTRDLWTLHSGCISICRLTMAISHKLFG